ncbi:MAG: HAD family hydrolase [Paludibacteraceae bacterium]|nr:HAD family hydrolase [Paludibacteraceae bacterium]
MIDEKHVLNGVKNVVLDLDGTLYDKRGLARRIVARLWWSLPLLLIDRKAHGPLWRWVVRTRWYRRIYLPTMVRLIGAHCPVRKEVVAFIEACRLRQIPMAVYSDYAFVREKLAVLGIDATQFRWLIDSPSLGARKPSREAAQKLLQMMEADPRTTLFVGDRDDTDGETARLVGAKFLMINKNSITLGH